ncbi:acyl carrier protein [Sphaerisporangium rufum]|nr:acyl carrier protein [Sphaerisporangium rufum]
MIERLESLPRSERRAALESVVTEQFRAALLMTPDEELPTAASYFDLGLTSLGLADVKQRLETLIGHGISSTVMFNSPTVERLMAYLTGEVLAALFHEPRPETSGVPAPAAPAGDELWDDVLGSLYRT